MSAPSQPSQPSVAPRTTEQEDITLAGQRRINLLWEWTQAIIAVTVVIATMALMVYKVVANSAVDVPDLMVGLLFLVVGTYFQRTNHNLIGGVGRKSYDEEPYRGR